MESRLIKILELIQSKKYPFPENCTDWSSDSVVLANLYVYGLFSNDGFSYISKKYELITIPTEEFWDEE